MKIVGDYHTHTVNSDGHDSIEEVVMAAAERGLSEIAVTDHGHGKFFGGLKPKKYAKVAEQIAKAGSEHSIKTYFGIEANIRGIDGRIDVAPGNRTKVDILLLGVHRFIKPAGIKSFFDFFLPNWFWGLIHWTPKKRIRKNTETVKRAIEKNDIDIYTHPNRYFKVNVVEIAKVCADRKTLVELNGSRISFRPIDFERMLAVGAKFIINSDAHYAKRVGVVDRVYEFLKCCDFDEKDIINLSGTFRRPSAGLEKKLENTKPDTKTAEKNKSRK